MLNERDEEGVVWGCVGACEDACERACVRACMHVCVKKRYAWVHCLMSISVNYNMKLAVYHELSLRHVPLSNGKSWLMLPSHGDTSELGVVPCGRIDHTGPHGTKLAIRAPSFPAFTQKIKYRLRYEQKVNTVVFLAVKSMKIWNLAVVCVSSMQHTEQIV